MELQYDYWIGTEKHVINCINRSIGQFKRHYKNVIIGITNNLEKRKKEHAKDPIDWELMVIKCRTTSISFITEIKETLADSNQDYITNEKISKGSERDFKYYIYVLLKEY